MEGISIRDCWAQEPMKRPSADKVVERLQLLHPVDERPVNQIGTSFFMHLSRDQVSVAEVRFRTHPERRTSVQFGPRSVQGSGNPQNRTWGLVRHSGSGGKVQTRSNA